MNSLCKCLSQSLYLIGKHVSIHVFCKHQHAQYGYNKYTTCCIASFSRINSLASLQCFEIFYCKLLIMVYYKVGIATEFVYQMIRSKITITITITYILLRQLSYSVWN